MRRPFKEHHLIQVLNEFEEVQIPLDAFLSKYLRRNKAVGSKDRKYIADSAYAMTRWRGRLDDGEKNPSWEKRFERFQNFSYNKDPTLEPHVEVSFPKWYYNQIVKNYGEKAKEICLISNQQAPTTIRVNTLLIRRDRLLKKWDETYSISPTKESPNGILFHKKINFFATTEFKAGYFEVQDEGSQMVSFLVDANPGEKILDYCAGSGGKTLAFAPSMKETGQIYLHDIREYALLEAKKRLRRAGIQNAQILTPSSRQKNNLIGKMDKLLLDVPCSGSGTLRRNPDMKWRFRKENLENLITEQRKIFEESLKFVKKGGKIFYATCSLFKDENELQIDYFTDNFPVKLVRMEGWLPQEGGKDGFFAAILEKL